jgi:hypothetical protein
MVARDVALDSLYDARSALTALIVGWSPDPAADPAARAEQASGLEQLILERDRVNGAINAVIAAEFQDIATAELMAAARALGAATAQLKRFGKAIAEVNEVIKVADAIVQAAASVAGLAAKA